MTPAANELDHVQRGAWINLLLPGAGLVLCGATMAGLVVGVVFAVSANIALVATLLFPDDFGPGPRALAIGVAGGVYLGGQIRYAQTVRGLQRAAAVRERRERLGRTQRLLASGDVAGALQAIAPLTEANPDDLVAAYRLAQVLMAAGNGHAARVAWKRVKQLDRHRLYAQQVAEAEQHLRSALG